jgi:hypothetical protein
MKQFAIRMQGARLPTAHQLLACQHIRAYTDTGTGMLSALVAVSR